MAAYAAALTLKDLLSFIKNKFDVILDPERLEFLESALKELKSFQNFVERLDSRSRSREKMSASLAKIAEAMYEFVAKINGRGFNSYYDDYEDFEEEILSLVEPMKKVYSLLEEEAVTAISSVIASKSKMVGLRDERRQFKENVMCRIDRCNVYPIVGMAGVGKTALAREIFEDLDISEWFDCRAWVTVGNEWNSEKITEDILAQVNPEVKVKNIILLLFIKITQAKKISQAGFCQSHASSNQTYPEGIGEGLKESLTDKRYLIVLDDVWNYDVNKYLRKSFSYDGSGSLVLITTRIKLLFLNDPVVSYHFCDMRLLNKEESWDLLREKVFAGAPYPSHLEDIGKKIAEKCDGLPLTILTIADPLSKADESLWIDVATKRKHQIFIDAYDQISEVLYPSYELLNANSKLCYLYLAAFPHKYEIPKSRLINLWVAEGLVEPNIHPTLESFSVERLRFYDLSALIMVYQRGSTSEFPALFGLNVKTCRLHSSWWHFCEKEARKTNFYLVLDCYNRESLEEDVEGHSRLSFHNNVLFALKHVYHTIEEICASSALSLLCLGPYSQYMVPVCFGLKLLMRLDALNIRFYDFPVEVLELVKLRYLALTCNGNLPHSISNLQKLRYLIVHPHLSIKSRAVVSYHMPIEIWDLKRLKHLEVMGWDLPDVSDTSFQKLVTLLGVTTDSCIILKRVPNLTKLGIRIELAPEATEPLCCFNHISHLTKLESFKCVIVNPEFKLEVVSPVAPFPSLSFSLKKLNLSGLGYPWEEMSKIASLPNLDVLKLRFNAFRGSEWEVEENAFPNLSFLLIEDMDLVKLKWSDGSFKNLEFVRIKHCYRLEKLDLGDIQIMWDIEVVDCGPLVEWHVKHDLAMSGSVEVNLQVHSSWKS